MQELKLNLNEEKNEMCISFKLEKDENKVEISSEITRFYDWREFQKNLLDAFYFYLNNHSFSEFEIANDKNTYHIILTMDDIIVISDKYKEINSNHKIPIHYQFEWYPLSKEYSYLYNYPIDIKDDWKKILEETKKYLQKDGIEI